jgi:hypothetical protein
MTIRGHLGEALYEGVRKTLRAAFPGHQGQIDDSLVDSVIHELQRRDVPGIGLLNLPAPPAAPTQAFESYPLYVAHAQHHRVLAMNSDKPFHSEFVGYLPTVRVPLPQALNLNNESVWTAIGNVDFGRDHLAGSVELLTTLFQDELGYAPARVDLITPARVLGVRFAAIAVYLGYRNATDATPSFYVLEAGLATGQAAMLYLGPVINGTIVKRAGYTPTPFSSPDNTYTGTLEVVGDEPSQLRIFSQAPGQADYIEVIVNYEAVATPPLILPVALTVEAVARVALIGKTMDVPVGMPSLIEAALAEVAKLFIPWVEKPGWGPTAMPRWAAHSLTSPFVSRLLSIARTIVTTHDGLKSQVGPRHVVVPQATKDDLVKLLDDVDSGRELQPTSRLVTAFGQMKIVRETASLAALPNGASVAAAAAAVALGSGEDGSTTGTGQRQTWVNQLANQRVQPLQILHPTSLSGPGNSTGPSLESILANALALGCRVKAAGSGHSYSDVATTPDFFLDTHGLSAVASATTPIQAQLSPEIVRGSLSLVQGPVNWPGYTPETNHALIEMEAGITIRALNTLLDSWNLGLINMGGYDGQTIVGAISTSTHGSGISIGPFPDMVRSLVLATSGRWNGQTISGGEPSDGVRFYRIEPSNGITDPSKYSDPQVALIQDDACFNAVICSMGCFGVIYSVVLEVMQAYWLQEKRYWTTLDQVLSDLQPNPKNPGSQPDVLLNTRNYEVLIHPYPIDGLEIVTMDPGQPAATYYKYFACVVTERNITAAPETPTKPRTSLPDWLGIILALALDEEPQLTPAAVDISLLTLLESSYVNKSYEVFNLGLGGGVGFAAEMAFSLAGEGGAYDASGFQSAIDKIHSIAQMARLQGNQYQSSAFSLRFVKASPASLSMMEGRDTAMIEMDMLTGTYGGAEIMERYETSMYELGARPHWGLDFDFSSASQIASLYPRLSEWLAVYRQLNAKGTFDNAFTRRVGFTNP